MKKNRIITILIWAVIIGVIIYMVSGGLSAKEPEELSFSAFIEKVEAEEVKAVQETLGYGMFYGLYQNSDYEAKDLPGKADFILVMSEDSFTHDLAVYLAGNQGVTAEDITTADYPFTFSVAQPEGQSWLVSLLPYLFMIGLVVVFWVFIARQQGGGKQVMNFGKSHARVQTSDKNRITFADVAGADEEKAELQEIVEFMRDPKRFDEIGARIPKGVLLVGPPGTGKTLMARAVAGEAKVPFFSISGSDFVEMFVGVGASRVRDLFATAKRATPAVVFIDEIDAVGRQRGAGLGGGHDEREQTLNQLLVEMDGFAANEGIIVLAATNRADILDPALLRPGRFDRQIVVQYPDVKGREEILKVHARNKKFTPEVNLAVLARRTPGFTGADLENVLNEAAILAARENKKRIGMKDLEEAVTRVQMGPEKKSRVVTPEDRRYTAYHEAGHAILTLHLEKCDKLHEVSIIARGWAGGYTMTLPKDDLRHMTMSRMLDNICMAMGGRVAEKLKFGDISTGASQDLKQSSDIARKMVEEYGMSEAIGPVFLGGDTEVFIAKEWGHGKNYSEQMAAEIDAEVRRILEEQFARAEDILSHDSEALDRTSEMLLKYERVTGEQFEAVYHGEDADSVMERLKVVYPDEPETASATAPADGAKAPAEQE